MKYPRIHSIVVPYNVKMEYIGAYASFLASEYIMKHLGGEILLGSETHLLPHPHYPRLFLLTYQAATSARLPIGIYLNGDDDALAEGETEQEVEEKVLHVGRLHATECRDVETKQSTVRTKGRPSPAYSAKSKRL